MKGLLLVTTALSLLFAGCGGDVKSARGFSLPEGDPEKGRAAFVKFECNGCHAIEGVEKVDIEGMLQDPIELGGKVTRLKTHGELVTSIINPNHKIVTGYPLARVKEGGNTKMPDANRVMTVQELIDLVAFVESSYSYDRYSYRATKEVEPKPEKD
jgi:mono/diheme cytochrome c family protein